MVRGRSEAGSPGCPRSVLNLMGSPEWVLEEDLEAGRMHRRRPEDPGALGDPGGGVPGAHLGRTVDRRPEYGVLAAGGWHPGFGCACLDVGDHSSRAGHFCGRGLARLDPVRTTRRCVKRSARLRSPRESCRHQREFARCGRGSFAQSESGSARSRSGCGFERDADILHQAAGRRGRRVRQGIAAGGSSERRLEDKLVHAVESDHEPVCEGHAGRRDDFDALADGKFRCLHRSGRRMRDGRCFETRLSRRACTDRIRRSGADSRRSTGSWSRSDTVSALEDAATARTRLCAFSASDPDDVRPVAQRHGTGPVGARPLF